MAAGLQNIGAKLGEAACVWLAQWGASTWYGLSGPVQTPGLGVVSYGVGSGAIMAIGSLVGQFVEDFFGVLDLGSEPINLLVGVGVGAGVSTAVGSAFAPGVVASGGGAMNWFGQAAISNFVGGALYAQVKAPLLGL